MSNEVAVKQSTEVAFPANLAVLFAGKSNLVQHDTVPSISYKGKVFCVNKEGVNKQLLDEEGNALPMIEVVVLNSNPSRSRTFYEGGYVEGSTAPPSCHSYTGKHPASDIETPQSDSCESCPQSIKGSKVTEQGNPTTACSLRQRIVVVPSDKLNFTALLVNMASTSCYNPDSPDTTHGWFDWDSYKKELVKRGVPHTAAVKTKIRFAAADAFPRLQFKFAGILDEAQIQQVLPRIDSDEVQVLLNKDHGKAEGAPKQIAAPKPAEEPKETPVAQEVKQEAPKPAAKPKAKPAVVQEPAQEAPAKPKAAPVVVEDDKDIASVLSSWE